MKKLQQRLNIIPISQRTVRWMEEEQQRRTSRRRAAQIERALKAKKKVKHGN